MKKLPWILRCLLISSLGLTGCQEKVESTQEKNEAPLYISNRAAYDDKVTSGFERVPSSTAADPQALYRLGMAYISGDLNQNKDMNLGVQYLKQAAAAQFYPAQYALASLFLEGHPVLADRFQAIEYLRQAAEADLPDAQVKLAKLFSEFSLPQHDKIAFYWLEKAAQQQHREAKYLLARFYYEGVGTSVNYEKAFQLWLPFAQQGDRLARFQLGKLYCEGKGVNADLYEGVKWLLSAAHQGADEAKELLLSLFRKHYDEEKMAQEPQAREWLLYAAANEEPLALYVKAKSYLYATGGFEQNTERGIADLKLAASKGYLPARRLLAKIQEEGLFGFERNVPVFQEVTQVAPYEENQDL